VNKTTACDRACYFLEMLIEKIEHSAILNAEIQLLTDGYTCWAHTADGERIGRWSRLGIDIHLTLEEQLKQGRECLECVRGGSWERFREGMQRHYGIDIPEDFLSEGLKRSGGPL
jgi:hypothetical protein